MLNYKKTYTFPFKFEIPSYSKEFLEGRSFFKCWIKYIKRYLYILLNGQQSLEVFKISDNHQDILWINFSAPSMGDSLMDLSSRILLTNKRVDLLTHKKNANLYTHDLIFSSVFTNIQDVNNKSYDLVIIDSYSSRSIKIKTKVAPLKPFVGMYGYFNGPEVNRVLFSFHQMNNLLGYVKTKSEIDHIAKSLISISTADQRLITELKLPINSIAIAIGGEWDYRTYNNWDNVIKKLFLKDKNLQIILVGSENAKKTEKILLEKFSTFNLVSYVAKLTYNQTTQAANQTKLLFCCDGGLMHSAIALETVIIPLFARLDSEMQLTKSSKAFALFDQNDVNNILVEDIILKYTEAINPVHRHPQS